jgi:hypothetical protein
MVALTTPARTVGEGPPKATGLLVSSAGAYTHQAYAAFPRMETGRIVQGHACAVAAWHALRDKIAVHEVDVRKVQT